jgi:hypothetical protein
MDEEIQGLMDAIREGEYTELVLERRLYGDGEEQALASDGSRRAFLRLARLRRMRNEIVERLDTLRLSGC